MPEKNFYVSWVDKRTDPWPQWERWRDSLDQATGMTALPATHALWPGVPLLLPSASSQVADSRMGLFTWPGMPFSHEGLDCRLYLGPTLSALFHPASRYGNLKNLDRVFMLYQPEAADSPHTMLHNVLLGVGTARGIGDLNQRLQFVPIPGITDPTSHAQIIQAIEAWVRKKDPFEYGARNAAKTTTRIAVNLSAGTPAMHASWLILRWNGTLGKPQCIIDFVQGDGGLNQQPDAAVRDPLRTAPIDSLSQWLGDKKHEASVETQPRTMVRLDELGPPYDKLCRDLDHAALLGLPVLLQGERGTGKTFLARYYHDRRLHYRENLAPASKEKPKKEAKKAGDERFPDNAENAFVTVTLSEFADLENLRDTLFGWAKGSWGTGAVEAFDGLLGEAHGGTLFLDEIHHLDRGLQAALLGPLNSRRYRPKMAAYEIISRFDLVVATNDANWRGKMADDFRDRVERIVLDVPSFRLVQRHDVGTLWRFWEFTLRRRCAECHIPYNEGDHFEDCKEQLLALFKRHPLAGNWRDLQRLADNVLLLMTHPNDGRASPINWEASQLEHALDKTFAE